MNTKAILSAIEKTRNIGIIAHIDAGKTTVSERILYYTHKIHRMGEVHDGNTTMDFMPEEQERGITITAASTHCTWNKHNINLIDTPGHVDFTIEVERSLQVLDGAIGIFCAVGGVEPQSETVWKQSEALNIPKLAFINKLDRIGADFENVLESIEKRFSTKTLCLQIPLGQGQEFRGIADLIMLKKIVFEEEDQGETYFYEELKGDDKVEAELWREKLLEEIAELDDAFLPKFFDNSYSKQDIYTSLRTITLQRKATPVLMGSALKNIGIQPLLDAVCHLLPSPLDVAPLSSETYDEEKTKALVFKVLLENNHKFSFVRIYNGCLTENSCLYNVNTKTRERIDHIYKLHADFHERVDKAYAGDLVGIIGLKNALTGHTLSAKENDSPYEDFHKYKPVISLAFEPRNSEEADILDEALQRFSLEDPTLLINNEDGFRLVSGMGELHLAILKERIEREYKISPRTGNPQVVLKETLKSSEPITITQHFEKELAGTLHHAHIEFTSKANERGKGIIVQFSDTVSQILQKSYKPQNKEDILVFLTRFIQNILESGFSDKSIDDIIISINSMIENEHSSLLGLQNAIQQGLLALHQKAPFLTLSPIMKLEITANDENLGAVMNLLNTCKAKVEQFYDKQNIKCIEAIAPMQELFGFATSLRSVTQGRAGLSIQFLRFDNI